ncbi:cytochrome P450 [Mycolicibacterium chitae]|uniref:Steroid C26-monooxygenase n=1 Tax=Mycolicibacterium chitae TaxID=1792 RepID=A0A3S4SD07_MYCCI|nr:cytochrome P450 [Mycolicibacterium chitae]MCV7107598.1 cytochrome P450 [Mycolicibacterium chitae]BBZ01604.1 cytochrome P450 [Mycolicibacterium chitae]VEG50440.1 cytochrome P450 130 [Mycolicibacterium chitae]
MTVPTDVDLYYDPYNIDLNMNPYPVFARFREEAPLYYNEQHDFYALSRWDDVNKGVIDHETFISGRGALLELIKSGMEMPPGTLIFEDPPIHNIHRNLLSRVFTPRKVLALEPQIREFTTRCLDPLVGTGNFDFVNDLGEQMPMRVIGMLLGIPEDRQQAITDHGEETLNKDKVDSLATGEVFAEFVDWRTENPSDDIMTDLLNAEFEDETGTVRKLRRDELLLYLTVIATAGSETTTRMLGWAGKTLAEVPEQRRDLVQNPDLIPRAMEEILRWEPPALQLARYVTRDVEYYGHTVPEGSAMLLLVGAANRDSRRFHNGDVFDIHREQQGHMTFGAGTHFCMGNALARLELRIAMEEILKRFPEWEVDWPNAVPSETAAVRGWAAMPTFVP